MSNQLNFSKRTFALLSNFSKINPAICLEQGKQLRTADSGGSILAVAQIDEEIPSKFPISDLSSFLSILGLDAFKECTLTMDDKKIDLQGKQTTMTFFAGAESLVELPPGEVQLDPGEIKAVIPEGTFKDFKSACRFLKHEFCRISNRAGRVYLTALTPDTDTSTVYEVELGSTDQADSMVTLKVDNLKMEAGDYKLEAVAGQYARFTTMDDRVYYLIGAEIE